MRSRFSTAPPVIVVLSSTVLAVSLVCFASSVRAGGGGLENCTPNETSACSSCGSTLNVYQCRPAALPTGAIYGTCPAVAGTCPDNNFAQQDCGNTDWNCADPPVSMVGGVACADQTPTCCMN